MKLYPIDERIELYLEDCYDPETGEIREDLTEEQMFAEIEQLKIDHEELLDSIASGIKNDLAEAEAVKAEKLRLERRQKLANNRAERGKRLLAYLTKGQKWQNEHHKISYRKSTVVVVDDMFVEWASVMAPGLLKIEPEPRKDDIKRAINNGTCFEHAHLETKNNIQVL